MEVLNNYQRKKLDESNDEDFYSDPKFVYHLDKNFRQYLSELYKSEIDNYSTVLDLMASWDSCLPEGKKYKSMAIYLCYWLCMKCSKGTFYCLVAIKQ